MTPQTPDAVAATATDLLPALAAVAASVLPLEEPPTVGAIGRTLPTNGLDGKAVASRFTGSKRGELVVAVGPLLTKALETSALGTLQIGSALQPTLDATARTLGDVVLSPVQTLEPGAALTALLAQEDAAVVTLTSADGATQAVVGLALLPETSAEEAAVAAQLSMDLLRDIEMEVQAEIGHTRMTVSEILALTPGTVIELDRAAGAPADLLVNGRLFARGEVVVIDEHYGLRVTEIVTETQR